MTQCHGGCGKGSPVVQHYLYGQIFLLTKKMRGQHKQTVFKNPPSLPCGAGLDMKNFQDVTFRLQKCLPLSCATLA